MAGLDGTAPSRAPVPAAKLAAPRPVGQHVRRRRLSALLDAGSSDQVLLLSAPAGHGKTTLLAEWCEPDLARTAWVSLDQGDRTASALWSAVLAALVGCPAVPADSVVRELPAPQDGAAEALFVDRLTTALAEAPTTVRLVLDDLHVLAGSPALTSLASFAGYLRGGLQLVLATRSDPLLPLARWRVAGRLVEVRSDDLAFTPIETQDLVARTGLRLRPDQIGTLVAQTGGWAAGLRLATMSLATTEDPDSFLGDLVGNDRAIADYLVSEVLSRLPDDSLTLLRRLSVCDQLSASLAEALTGSPDAVRLLCTLEQESSLVVSHGAVRQWFRIHPLLRAYLTSDLRRSDPRSTDQLYAIAARWHSAAGHPAEALAYAGRSDDQDVTAEIVQTHALLLLSGGRYDLLRTAWTRCPVRTIDADPTLALTFALAFLDGGEASIAAELVSRADRSLTRHPDGDEHVAATHRWLRALVGVRLSWLSGDLDVGRAASAGAEETAIAGDTTAERALSHFTNALASAASGRIDEAERSATASVRSALLADLPYVAAQATVILSVVAVTAGDLRRAGTLAARADALAPPAEWEDTAEQSVTSGLRSYAALMAGDPEHAITLAGPSVRFHAGELAALQPTAAVATMVTAMARYDLGDRERALADIRAVREHVPTDPLSLRVLAVAAVWEQEIALRLGHADDARAVVRATRAALGPTGDVHYLAACSALARGRRPAATELLASITDGRCPPLTDWVLVAARIQAAALALDRAHESEVRRQLTGALRSAAAQGAVRPLVIAPDAVITWLAGDPQLIGGEHAELIATVLALRSAGQPVDTVPLTPRELEILAMLPTLGTVADIAGGLSVSVNTVKTHLKSIYDKLGVDSRRRAVEAGRRYGYLAS